MIHIPPRIKTPQERHDEIYRRVNYRCQMCYGYCGTGWASAGHHPICGDCWTIIHGEGYPHDIVPFFTGRKGQGNGYVNFTVDDLKALRKLIPDTLKVANIIKHGPLD